MADDKDKKIGEVPHLENVTGNEKIPVSADGEPRYIEVNQIGPKLQEGVKGNEKNYIFSDPTIQGKGAIAAARYRANEKGRLTAQYKYWGDTDFNYNTEFPQATEKTDGVMSADDKKKLEDVKELADTLNEGLGQLEKDAATKEELAAIEKQKADISELSNVIAEEVVDEDTFEDFGKVTREELKKDLFIDLWNSACGEWGKYDIENAPDKSAPFYLNELWLTYEEAIYTYWICSRGFQTSGYESSKIKTNIYPFRLNVGYGNGPSDNYLPSLIFRNCGLIEICRVGAKENNIVRADNLTGMFTGCSKLRKIIGTLYELTSVNNRIYFSNCGSLEEVKIEGLRNSCIVSSASKINYESFRFWIANAINTSPITITVHSDIYSALQGEAEYPFNGGTQEEWEQLLQDAATKNIQFATA